MKKVASSNPFVGKIFLFFFVVQLSWRIEGGGAMPPPLKLVKV